MGRFTSPVEGFDYLWREAWRGRNYLVDEAFDPERDENPLAVVGTGIDFTEGVRLDRKDFPGRVGEAALRLLALAPGFRHHDNNGDPRLFVRVGLQVEDEKCPYDTRFSVARYFLTRAAVNDLAAGREPSDPNYNAKWQQGWPPDEQIVSQSGGEVAHTRFVVGAQQQFPEMLGALSYTNEGVLRAQEITDMANYVYGRRG